MSQVIEAETYTSVPNWPQELVEQYEAAGFWRSETFGEALRSTSKRMGEQIAIIDDDTRVSFQALDRAANELAAGFAGLGLRKGDIAVVQLPNCVEFIEVAFALFRLGVVPIFALPAHRGVEVGAFCSFAKAKAYIIPDVVGGFDYRELAASVGAQAPFLEHIIVRGEPGRFIELDGLRRPPVPLPEIFANELACLQLSGGTTGIPKLIARCHRDYLYNVRASVEACDFHE
ncbi:MAG: AMP-binding protein, partial [Pseudolabrys sp.]